MKKGAAALAAVAAFAPAVWGATAKIGETEYDTLSAAVAAAVDGETVTLLCDTEAEGEIAVDKTLTVELADGSSANIDATLISKSGTLYIVGGDFAREPIADGGAVRISGGTFKTDSFKLYDADGGACALSIVADGCIPVVSGGSAIPVDGAAVAWTVADGYDAINVSTRKAYATQAANSATGSGLQSATGAARGNETVVVLRDVTMYHYRTSSNYGEIHIDIYHGVVIKSMEGRKYVLTDGGRNTSANSQYYPIKVAAESEVTFENLKVVGAGGWNFKGVLIVEKDSVATIRNVDLQGNVAYQAGSNGTTHTLNVYDSSFSGSISSSGANNLISVYSGTYSQTSFGSTYKIYGGTFTKMPVATVLSHIGEGADIQVNADGTVTAFSPSDDSPSPGYAAIVKHGETTVYYPSADDAFKALKDGEVLTICDGNSISPSVANANLTEEGMSFSIAPGETDYSAQIALGEGVKLETLEKNGTRAYTVVVDAATAQAAIIGEGGEMAYCSTIKSAVAKVSDDETIKVLRSVDYGTSYLTLNAAKKYSIDLNGQTIKASTTSYAPLYVTAGTVTVSGDGYVTNNGTGSYSSAVYVYGGSAKVVIVGGTFTGKYALRRGNGSVEVTGGTFVATGTGATAVYGTASYYSISGGRFTKAVAQASCASGYMPKSLEDERYADAPYTVVKAAAQIGSAFYETLTDAVAAADEAGVDAITILDGTDESPSADWKISDGSLVRRVYAAKVVSADGQTTATCETLAGAIAAAADGDTVTLLVDIELSATVEIPAGANITLDLGGKTISASGFGDKVNVIENKGTLTVKNGTIKVLYTHKKVYAILNDHGDLTATGVAIESTSGGIRVAGGTGTITDCRITVDSAGETTNAHAVYASDGANATIESGTYSYTGSVAQDTVQAADANTTLTINGGTFTSANSDSSKNPPKVVHTNKESPAIYITGGTFTGELGTNSGYVHASGGTFNVTFYAGVPYLRVSGGLFAQEVTAAMCADGYVPAEETVTIDGKAYYTVISPAVDSVVYAIENTAGVAVPAEWIKANVDGYSDGVTSANQAAVAAKLGETGANGVPYWQSYVLGFDPSDAGDNLRIAASAVAVEKTKVAISSEIDASKFNLPDGAKVTFRLAVKDGAADGGWATLKDGAATPAFTVDLAEHAGKTLAVFADIALRESAE